MSKAALLEAKKVLGSWAALGKACGVSQPVAYNWYHRNKYGIPADKVLIIEEKTGVSRYRLRPDVFGSAEDEGSE